MCTWTTWGTLLESRFWFVRSGIELIFCISNKFSRESLAAGLWTSQPRDQEREVLDVKRAARHDLLKDDDSVCIIYHCSTWSDTQSTLFSNLFIFLPDDLEYNKLWRYVPFFPFLSSLKAWNAWAVLHFLKQPHLFQTSIWHVIYTESRGTQGFLSDPCSLQRFILHSQVYSHPTLGHSSLLTGQFGS